MSYPQKTAPIRMIPIDRINVLNPRVRNPKIFKDIAGNIAQVGLKRPITVTSCVSRAPNKDYDLVCGQGRIEAFLAHGQKEIPAIIIEVTEAQALIMSLVENMARRHYSPVELFHGIELLQKNGYDTEKIAEKTGVTQAYVGEILKLMERGEERLLAAVATGKMPLGLAVRIASCPDDEQIAFQEVYQDSKLNSKKILAVKRQLDLRRSEGKSIRARSGRHKKGALTPSLSGADIMKHYKKEIDRKHLMNQKSDMVKDSLSFIITALRDLLKEDHFMTLLRAERITDIPAQIYTLVKKQAS